MIVAETLARQLEKASWIRRMFEQGLRLKQELGPENVFDFTLGNPDLEPPKPVLEALEEAARVRGGHVHGYMPNPGFPETREAVAKHLREQTGLPFTREHVLMTVGSAGACNTFLRAVLDPGDEVIVLAPWFSEYPFYVENHGGRMIPVETTEDFLPDVSKIAAAIGPRTKAIFLNSPNNPTGRVYPEEVLKELDELLRKLDQPVTVISDEPYSAIVFDGRRQPPVAALVERTVIANSWSKCFALAGERIGYLAISPRLPEAEALFNACAFTNRILGYINAPAIWQRVVARTIGVPPDVDAYQRRRDLMCEILERAGYKLMRPEGTFYVFPKSPLKDDVSFVRLLMKENILAVPGSGFGRAGYFRLSLTVDESTIRRAAGGFDRALKAAQAQREG